MPSPSVPQVWQTPAPAAVEAPCAVDLAQVLAPVRQDLARTEAVLSEYLAHTSPFIQMLTGHIEQFQGKRLRPALLHLAARAFGGEAPLACEVAALVEMIHLATLCHDDVLDEAATRRQVRTVNAEWGSKLAVLTGDYVLARASERLAALADPRPFRLLAGAARQVCEGELLQVGARFDLSLDEGRYFELIGKKTAALFGAAAELGALLAGAKDDDARRMAAFGQHLGLAFQIADDCLDLSGVESMAGKSLGADLRNGEYTLPIVHLLAHASPAEQPDLVTLLSEDSGDLARERLRAGLRAHGSIEYALETARREIARARDGLAGLPFTHARHALVLLGDYVLLRAGARP